MIARCWNDFNMTPCSVSILHGQSGFAKQTDVVGLSRVFGTCKRKPSWRYPHSRAPDGILQYMMYAASLRFLPASRWPRKDIRSNDMTAVRYPNDFALRILADVAHALRDSAEPQKEAEALEWENTPTTTTTTTTTTTITTGKGRRNTDSCDSERNGEEHGRAGITEYQIPSSPMRWFVLESWLSSACDTSAYTDSHLDYTDKQPADDTELLGPNLLGTTYQASAPIAIPIPTSASKRKRAADDIGRPRHDSSNDGSGGLPVGLNRSVKRARSIVGAHPSA